MISADDYRFMARALRLARRGLYATGPNPRVGCVFVRDGVVVGEGWHKRTGGPHAETHALAAAGGQAEGATMYVSLEPCAHQGLTPPCADALVAARIARAVVAMKDPNPLVCGKGLSRLQDAGIPVECGVLEDEAREINIGFVSRMMRGRPWVRLKLAASLDGKMALMNGERRWITGSAARRDGHRWRARACAVMTGSGTIRDDDPQLTVREVATSRQPLRVVVDSKLETLPTARVLVGGALIATATADRARIRALQDRGAEILVLPNAEGKVELGALMEELARRRVNELHVEAGFKLNGSLLVEGLVDELVVYLAPHVIGDVGLGMFSVPELKDLRDRWPLRICNVRMVGDDLRVVARPTTV